MLFSISVFGAERQNWIRPECRKVFPDTAFTTLPDNAPCSSSVRFFCYTSRKKLEQQGVNGQALPNGDRSKVGKTQSPTQVTPTVLLPPVVRGSPWLFRWLRKISIPHSLLRATRGSACIVRTTEQRASAVPPSQTLHSRPPRNPHPARPRSLARLQPERKRVIAAREEVNQSREEYHGEKRLTNFCVLNSGWSASPLGDLLLHHHDALNQLAFINCTSKLFHHPNIIQIDVGAACSFRKNLQARRKKRMMASNFTREEVFMIDRIFP